MSLQQSTMKELGTEMPDFTLPNTVDNSSFSLVQFLSDKATVIMFICNHCPYVKHLNSTLAEVAQGYIQQGIGFVAISANDVENYPEDSPENMKIVARENSYPFPYLYDQTQEVARSYGAVCTPDIFVINASKELIYRGRFDDSTPGNGKEVTGADLSNFLDSVLKGEPSEATQYPSMGCSIKWL